MSEWRPIETAPKNGNYVLILFDGEPHVARWVDPPHASHKWQWALRYEKNGSFNRELVTHWMPLPKMPKNKARRSGLPTYPND